MSISDSVVVAVDSGELFTRSIYHYKIREKIPPVGGRVLVPLGSKDTSTVGIVLGTYPPEVELELKPVLEIIDEAPLLSPYLLELLIWTSHYYMSPFFQGLRLSLPHPLYGKGVEKVQLITSKEEVHVELTALRKRGSTLKGDILEYVLLHPETTLDLLRRRFKGGIKKAVQDLATKGLLKISPLRYIYRKDTIHKASVYFLASEEKPSVFRPFPNPLSSLKKGEVDKLLKSGRLLKKDVSITRKRYPKEENYHHIIEGEPSLRQEYILERVKKVLKKGGQVLIISPRLYHSYHWLSLIFKTTGRKPLLWSEHKSLEKRTKEWEGIRTGLRKIVVGGPRSLYLPFNKLSLVVIDEPESGSLRLLASPEVDAMTAALFIKEKDLSSIIISTSFLNPTLLYLKESGSFKRIKMGEKVNNPFRFVDLPKEDTFPSEITIEIDNVLNDKGIVLYLLNRRGYYTASLCKNCGFTFKCPNCNLNLVYHLKTGLLHCHSCGFLSYLPQKCPRCNSSDLAMVGVGTQRISEELESLFGVKVLRIDKDVIEEKGRETILRTLKDVRPLIVVGTDLTFSFMYDFKPLLCIYGNPDLNLRLPDFRGEERVLKTAYLLLRWSGNPVYMLTQGELPINPELWEEEGVREILDKYEKYGYPPYKRLVAVYYSGTVLSSVKTESFRIKEMLDMEFKDKIKSYVLNYKSKGRFVGVVLLKVENEMDLYNRLFDFFKTRNSWIKLVPDPQGLVF